MRTTISLPLFLLALCVLRDNAAAQSASSIQFDGKGTQVSIGNSPLFAITDALTLEAWVKVDPAQTCPYPRIINKFNHVENRGYNLIVNNGRLFMEVRAVNGKKWYATGRAINDGAWHHVAGTFSGTAIRVYVDGILDAEATFAPTTIALSRNDLRIGFDGGSERSPFKGAIDEVRIWNVAKSTEEIQAHSGQCLSGQELGLVGYWRFDEGSGTSTADLTGHGNNGTLLNGAAWMADGHVCSGKGSDAPKAVPSIGTTERSASPAVPKGTIRSLSEKGIFPVLFPDGHWEGAAYAWSGIGDAETYGGHIAIDTIIRFKHEGREKAAVVISQYTLEEGKRQTWSGYLNGLSCAVLAKSGEGSWETTAFKKGIMAIGADPEAMRPKVGQAGKDEFILRVASYIILGQGGEESGFEPVEQVDVAYMNVKDLERVLSTTIDERATFLPSEKAWYDVEVQTPKGKKRKVLSVAKRVYE